MEGKRRAQALQRSYVIYQHKRNTGDHILRQADFAAPNPGDWKCVATLQANGAAAARRQL
jgi:hypothetical protein